MTSTIPSTRLLQITRRYDSEFPVQDFQTREEASKFCETLAARFHPAIIAYDPNIGKVGLNMHPDQLLSVCKDLNFFDARSSINHDGSRQISANVQAMDEIDGPDGLSHLSIRLPSGIKSVIPNATTVVDGDRLKIEYKGKELWTQDFDPTEASRAHDNDGVKILGDGEYPVADLPNMTQILITGYD